MNFYLLQYYYGRDEGIPWSGIIGVAIVLFIVASIIKGSGLKRNVLSHWHHRFDEHPFSPQEFYTGIKETLTAKEMSQVYLYIVDYAQGGILSPSRKYLRVRYKEFYYDICAAPFAKGFFVSWWLGEIGDPIRDFLINLPAIGKLFVKREKTFFELDTEIMFKEMVTVCVRETLEKLTVSKGLRNLTDAEWKEVNRAY